MNGDHSGGKPDTDPQRIREAHPWWGAPARLLQLYSFNTYERFQSEPGEKWPAIGMRLGTLAYHLVGQRRSRVLVVSNLSEIYTAQLAWLSSQVDRSKWRVVSSVTSREQQAKVRASVDALNVQAFVESIDVVRSFQTLPYADSSFDMVVAFGPLYELENDADRNRFVHEVSRVLVPEGIVVAAFKQRQSSSVQAVLRTDRWQTVDDLMHLTVFADPESYPPLIDRPPQLSAGYYADIEEVREHFLVAEISEVELVPVNPVTAWVSPEGWKKVGELGEAAFNTLLTLEDAVARNPSMVGMSPELLFVGTKHEADRG